MDWLKNKLMELHAVEGYILPLAGDGTDYNKLDTNENLFLPQVYLTSLARAVATEIDPRFYPTHEYHELTKNLSERIGITQDRLVIGSGGDQLIDFLARTFLDRGTKAVSITPTYSFYRLRSLLVGAQFTEVPLRTDFSLDLDALRDALSNARILFICSPNNPTGNQFPKEEISFLADKFQGLVVVDEAYAEFAEYRVADLIEKHKNVILLRTFSKAFGLAGMRLGYLIADPIISKPFLEKVQYPYPVNSFALRLATKLLQNYDRIESSIAEMKRERGGLIHELSSIGLKAFPSSANFILVPFGKQSNDVWTTLTKQHILVKNIGDVLQHNGCLRITVGPNEVNRKLVGIVNKLIK